MSRSKIDKAIYDQERYDRLREQGVSEGRAKRVSTVPLRREKKLRDSSDGSGIGDESVADRELASEPNIGSSKVSTTSPRTGI